MEPITQNGPNLTAVYYLALTALMVLMTVATMWHSYRVQRLNQRQAENLMLCGLALGGDWRARLLALREVRKSDPETSLPEEPPVEEPTPIRTGPRYVVTDKW